MAIAGLYILLVALVVVWPRHHVEWVHHHVEWVRHHIAAPTTPTASAMPTHPTEFVTPRLHLRTLLESDLEDYHAIWSNPDVVKWTYVHRFHEPTSRHFRQHINMTHTHSSRPQPCKTLKESRAWMSPILSTPENPDTDNFGLFLLSQPDRMLGIIGTIRSPPELGYILHPDIWGQGYATEAVKGFVEWYFRERQEVEGLRAVVAVRNDASVRILEKCGFREVGRGKGFNGEDVVNYWIERLAAGE